MRMPHTESDVSTLGPPADSTIWVDFEGVVLLERFWDLKAMRHSHMLSLLLDHSLRLELSASAIPAIPTAFTPRTLTL